MSGKTSFDCNLRGMTGSKISKRFIELTVGSKWKEPKTQYFFYDVDETSGSNEISDREEECFTITSEKTDNQPYNGVIDFTDVHRSQKTWEFLKTYLKCNTFRKSYQDYLGNQVDRMNFKLHKNIACVLLSFEIARREDLPKPSKKYPITRRMTSDAIDEVFSCCATAKEYKDKVDSLVKMFSSGRACNKYKGRKEGYDEIINYSTRQTSSDPNVVELSRKLATTKFSLGRQ